MMINILLSHPLSALLLFSSSLLPGKKYQNDFIRLLAIPFSY